MKKLPLHLLGALLSGATLLALSSCSPPPYTPPPTPKLTRLTKANLAKIKVGMQRVDVEKLLGTPSMEDQKDFMMLKKVTDTYVEMPLQLEIVYKETTVVEIHPLIDNNAPAPSDTPTPDIVAPTPIFAPAPFSTPPEPRSPTPRLDAPQ